MEPGLVGREHDLDSRPLGEGGEAAMEPGLVGREHCKCPKAE